MHAHRNEAAIIAESVKLSALSEVYRAISEKRLASSAK